MLPPRQAPVFQARIVAAYHPRGGDATAPRPRRQEVGSRCRLRGPRRQDNDAALISMNAKAVLPSPKFGYRHNPDGTWDSICLACFLTVGTAGQLEALVQFEDRHECFIPLDLKKPAAPSRG